MISFDIHRHNYNIDYLINNWCIVDVSLEDVMWVKFQHQKSGCVVFVAVCYVPPVGLSQDVDVAECLLVLEEQTQKFQTEGQVVFVVSSMLGVVS